MLADEAAADLTSDCNGLVKRNAVKRNVLHTSRVSKMNSHSELIIDFTKDFLLALDIRLYCRILSGRYPRFEF